MQIFEGLIQQGKTVLMVTHDRSQLSRFSRVYQIQDGRLSRREEGAYAG
jgi:ABC-type lipoprotein export system ATPase subunit